MNAHIETARRQLSDLASLADQTERMERTILESATSRLKAVESELDNLKGTAITDPQSSDRYQELTEERGLLHQVIARAQAELGHST